MSDAEPTVVLVRGGDDAVLRDAVRSVVDELVGEADRTLVLEDVEVGAAEGDDGRDPLVALVEAAQTPPFLAPYRVVVGRVVDKREKADAVAALVDYLADPLPTTRLVIEWRGGRMPKSLTAALEQAGARQIDATPARRTADWVAEQLRGAGLKLDRGAQERLVDWVGDDPSRLLGMLELLRSTYGEGAHLGADEVVPFLGEEGGVPPWELTDAIDRGDRSAALELLHRMLGSGRHPFQVLATLHTHVSRLLRLDGLAVTSEREAAAVLGLKGSTYPAKKAMAQARRLGHDRIVRAVRLVHEADLDLRGAKAWPPELVLEVLVARLAV